MSDLFWLSESQFARLAPHLPTDTRGKPRVDDRRVISGIIHVLKSGGRWVDAPAAYGPRKTLAARSTSRMRRTDLLMPGCQ
jgi:transposase